MSHTTFFKSAMTTRAEARDADERGVLKARRAVYLAVDLRDKNRCRACGRQVFVTVRLTTARREHHHISGRYGSDAETTGNVALLCKGCHDERHVKRTLQISGDADRRLTFEQNGRRWTS